MNRLLTTLVMLGVVPVSVMANTVAHWRFEGAHSQHVDSSSAVEDISGNGNTLFPWSVGGDNGYVYRNKVGYPTMPGSNLDNRSSVKNTGSRPDMATRSTDKSYGPGSYPSGINAESITPSQFTVEVFFCPEDHDTYRTIIGRDTNSISHDDPKHAAFYLQIKPNNNISATFVDLAGYSHTVTSANDMINGFDFPSDPMGNDGRWYYAAAVSNGSTFSLYLANITAGTDPVLVDSIDLNASGSNNTALARGSVNGTFWHSGSWSVGRGMYNGTKTDRAYGYIDEVRISDKALSVNEFLMMPKPTADLNPIFDAADPHIMFAGNRVYVYPTSGYYRHTFVYRSTNMASWTSYGPILNFDEISWIEPGKNCWAPGMIKKNGKYYLYYSVGPKPSSIGVAWSASALGAFTDKGSALLSDNNVGWFEAIDPMAFTDPQTNISYLYCGGSAGSTLRVFQLNDDMMSFAREISVENPQHFTEGAFMHYRDGVYYLSYSSGYWKDASYSVHYCTAPSPVGPWTYRKAILKSDGWFKGPGHHSIMYNPAMDDWYICYHRWNERMDNGPYEGGRSTAIDMLYYDENGLIKPVVQTDKGVGPVRLKTSLLADFDYDGEVNVLDLALFAQKWLSADYNADIWPAVRDGKVDMNDFAFFNQKFWMQSLDSVE